MKKISKLLSILLAAALGMSLAACGGESTSTPAAASQSLGEVTSPQSTAPEHSEAPGRLRSTRIGAGGLGAPGARGSNRLSFGRFPQLFGALQ